VGDNRLLAVTALLCEAYKNSDSKASMNHILSEFLS